MPKPSSSSRKPASQNPAANLASASANGGPGGTPQEGSVVVPDQPIGNRPRRRQRKPAPAQPGRTRPAKLVAIGRGGPGGTPQDGSVVVPDTGLLADVMDRRNLERDRKSVYVDRDEVLALMQKKFGPLWSPRAAEVAYIGDSDYYCPPLDEAARIVRRAGLSQTDYTSEIFDCDDYAYALKGAFAQRAYDNGRDKPFAFALGMVWLEQPTPHALNWIIAWPYRQKHKRTIYLVEPQNGNFYDIDQNGVLTQVSPFTGEKRPAPPHRPYRDIYFVAI